MYKFICPWHHQHLITTFGRPSFEASSKHHLHESSSKHPQHLKYLYFFSPFNLTKYMLYFSLFIYIAHTYKFISGVHNTIYVATVFL